MPHYIETFVSPLRDNPVAQVAVAAVLILTLIDVVFGLINAVSSHTYDSAKMREGLAHKSVSLGAMLVGVVVDGAIVGGLDLGFSAPVLVAVCAYLCIMELGSLVETFGKLSPDFRGSPVYQLLKSANVKKKGE